MKFSYLIYRTPLMELKDEGKLTEEEYEEQMSKL